MDPPETERGGYLTRRLQQLDGWNAVKDSRGTEARSSLGQHSEGGLRGRGVFGAHSG